MILVGCLHNSSIKAQQGKVDLTFNTADDGQSGDGFDNTVRTLSLQSDQKLIVGGDYLSLNGVANAYLTRLQPDGSIDETFNTGTGFNGKIYATYIQSDGKIIVGGSFTAFNGINAERLIRLNVDGSYDATFNTTIAVTNGIVYDICQQADGKIIIVGSFTKYNNYTVNRVARILPNGVLDTTFITGSGSSLNITHARILSDGKILLTGNFTGFNNTAVNRMVKLHTDGSVDADFNIGTGFNADVNAVSIQPDGKIILGGNFTSYNGVVANRIIRINEDASRDTSFSTGSGFSHDAVQVIKTDFYGNIMIGGSFTDLYNGTEVNRICFLNLDGSFKSDFDIGSGPGSSSVLALANTSDGSWYVGGSFSVFDGLNQGRLAKITSDGEHDTGYLSAGIGFDNSVLKIVPLPNKKTMLFGSFTKFNGVFNSGIARILEDGRNDSTFNSGKSGANNLIRSAVIQSDDKIICGGSFTKYNETISNRIVRILPDGAIDNTFVVGSGFNSQIYAMAIQPDQKVIVAGNFTSYNGTTSARIIRLLQNGLRDPGFNIGLGADAIIETLYIQPDGKILAGGRFNTFNGNVSPRLVRLNPDGSVDSGFIVGTGFDKYVYAIGVQSDQKIIVGGSFLTYKGNAEKRIVRLNPNGSIDFTFDSGAGFNKGDVRSILIQPDDRILAGGTFSGLYKTNISMRLIRLEKTGNYDLSFAAQLNNKVNSMGFTSDYKLIIGGDFNSISGISKHRIARLKLCLDSTVWNGISWSNGFPSDGKEITFKDNYSNLTTANVCSCSIDAGKEVTLLSGNALGIEFAYTGSGILNMEDSASLYQSDDDIINTGIIHLKRKSSPILQSDYTYWSAPVQYQKLGDVSPNTAVDKFFSFDSILKNWRNENPSNIMIPGKGYIIRGPLYFSTNVPTNFEAVFKGIPNNGKVNANLEKLDEFSLIGNPYPSALNADAFLIKNKSKIVSTLYFWTHNTPIMNRKYTIDDYAVYNLLGGVGTRAALASGINETVPDGTIAAGQAFFISSKVSGIVDFDNSMRIAGRNSSFFKPGKNNEEIKRQNGIEKHRIWLNFKNSEGLFKQILVGYIQGATNLYGDDYDALALNANQWVDFYSIVENKKLVIQGRALPLIETDSIDLGYRIAVNGNFSFSIDHRDGLLKDLDVFIEDKELKIIHDLKEEPYFFSAQAGTFNDRFVLKYSNKALGSNEFQHPENNTYVLVKDKILKVTSTKEFIKEISVFDILGKRLYHKRNVESKEYQISSLSPQSQVLLVRVKLESEIIIDKKVMF